MIMGAGSRFREILAKNGLVEAMAAHSPLSAMLAAEAGFDAIWASGFELSAMYGVPDVSIVSMTQHLDMTRAMAERSGIPVVADIDTGFGNAINVLYAVEQYERAGAAAIVMEDKSFPKVTSLIAGGRQDMVRIEEFQGKIEAARSVRKDKDLVIVARTEALIAGLGQAEALKRARAYEAAGADMILVHSKQKTPDEIEAFVKAWDGKAPIALAVSEGYLPPVRAFAAAQLDELYQLERWGSDPTATQRHENIRRDIEAGARFLALLGDGRLKG
jgi:phosphoenolpyruvate phosphomutase